MRPFRIALNLDEAALVHAMLKYGFTRDIHPARRAQLSTELLATIDDQIRRADALVARIAKALGQ